jgi:hypothetical protein
MEFLIRRIRGWSSKEQGGPRATPMDPVCIHESDEEEGVEQQSMEGQVTTQRDAKEGEIPKVGMQPPKEV